MHAPSPHCALRFPHPNLMRLPIGRVQIVPQLSGEAEFAAAAFAFIGLVAGVKVGRWPGLRGREL